MLRLSSLLCACAAVALWAQNDTPPKAQSEDAPLIIKADSRLVVLHASVVDRKGKLLTDLPQSAFKVYENGAEQSIKVFKREDVLFRS